MNAVHLPKSIGEGSDRIGIHTVKIVPDRVGAREILGPDDGHLFLSDRKTHDRKTVLLVDSGFLEFLEKGKIAVSVKGIDHDPAAWKGFPNGLHYGHDIGATQRQVDFADNLGSARGCLRVDDRIGGARVDVVGAHQENRLAPVLE